jgi:hypothetical protein
VQHIAPASPTRPLLTHTATLGDPRCLEGHLQMTYIPHTAESQIPDSPGRTRQGPSESCRRYVAGVAQTREPNGWWTSTPTVPVAAIPGRADGAPF